MYRFFFIAHTFLTEMSTKSPIKVTNSITTFFDFFFLKQLISYLSTNSTVPRHCCVPAVRSWPRIVNKTCSHALFVIDCDRCAIILLLLIGYRAWCTRVTFARFRPEHVSRIMRCSAPRDSFRCVIADSRGAETNNDNYSILID